MMASNETVESRKKKMVRNLYSSGIPIDIIALQTDLSVTEVLKIIEEIESSVPEIACPYCGSIFKKRRELLMHVSRIHIGGYY